MEYPTIAFFDIENSHYKKEKSNKGEKKKTANIEFKEDSKDMNIMMKNRSTCNLKHEISWNLYENPFYYSDNHQQQCQSSKQLHQVVKPFMDSETGIARAKIMELKAELDYECKTRKRMESLNKKLAKQVAEERRGKEVLKTVCEKLATEMTSMKSEIDRIKNEFEEEKNMLKVAEVLREERVHMKLADAKILFEEKVKELEEIKRKQSSTSKKNKESTRFALSEKSSSSCYDNTSMMVRRKTSKEPENPHIKRGIKGFVEFPRVVRAIGSKSRCQKAQLCILPTSK